MPRKIKPIKIKQKEGNGSTRLSDLGLTLVYPFFGEEKRFETLFDYWNSYSSEIKDSLQIVIVDDHGTPPIDSLMTKSKDKHCDFNLAIYRIEDDLKFNTPGALNLGIMCSSTPWILIMDSDCMFENNEMKKLIEFKPDPLWQYKFPRKRITNDEHWAKNVRYLPCTMLFHKNMFLDIGGFDEDFTGSRSNGYAFFDNHFDHKTIDSKYHIGQVSNITAIEWMDDFVGERISRTKREEHINRILMYKKLEGTVLLNREILRFAWRRKYINVR